MTLKELDEHGGKMVTFRGHTYILAGIIKNYVGIETWQVKLLWQSERGQKSVIIAKPKEVELTNE